MAATLTKVKGRAEVQLGSQVAGVLFDFTGDASYVTGGYAVTPAQLGMRVIVAVLDLNSPQTAGGTGKLVEYDAPNKKIKILVSAAAASALQEVANASNQSTVTRRLLALGN